MIPMVGRKWEGPTHARRDAENSQGINAVLFSNNGPGKSYLTGFEMSESS